MLKFFRVKETRTARLTIFVFLSFLFSFSLISSLSVGEIDVTGVVINPPFTAPFNNQTGSVNSSTTANFWDLLDTPADILGSLINNDLGWITTDTNASTECSNGEYLDGSSSCINFNSTVLDLTKSITYNATTIVTAEGTLDSGDVNSINKAIDGDSYNVSEDGGASPLLIYVNYTGVESFNQFIVREYYQGGSGHIIDICGWNYDLVAWDCSVQQIEDMDEFAFVVIDVVNSQSFIGTGGNDGVVQIKFDHEGNGNPSHNFFLDYAVLVDGFSGISTEETDPLAFHKSGDTIMQGNSNWGGFNLTNVGGIFSNNALWNITNNGIFQGDGSQLINLPSPDLSNYALTNQSNTFTGWQIAPDGFNSTNTSYFGTDTTPTDGVPVNFVRPDNTEATIDIIQTDVILKRDDAGGGIYNTFSEPFYSGLRDSPKGTLWWFDVNNIYNEGYPPNGVIEFLDYKFWAAAINDNPPNLVGSPGIMYLPDYDEYYRVNFTSWTSGGGGGWAYTRTQTYLPNTTGGIVFNGVANITKINWNYGGGTINGRTFFKDDAEIINSDLKFTNGTILLNFLEINSFIATQNLTTKKIFLNDNILLGGASFFSSGTRITGMGGSVLLLGGINADFLINSVSVGLGSGTAVDGTDRATLVGDNSGANSEDMDYSVAIGSSALSNVDDCDYCIGIGSAAGMGSDHSNLSMYFGANAGRDFNSEPNKFIVSATSSDLSDADTPTKSFLYGQMNDTGDVSKMFLRVNARLEQLDNVKFTQGNSQDFEMHFDGTNQIYNLTTGGYHIFDGGNISVDGIIYNSIIDKSEDALEWFEDGKDYVSPDGSVNHAYWKECATTYPIKDYSRPEIRTRTLYKEVQVSEKVCNLDETCITKQAGEEVCIEYNPRETKCLEYGDRIITEYFIMQEHYLEETYYPHTTTKEGYLAECVDAKQSQGMSNVKDRFEELENENKEIKSELCKLGVSKFCVGQL